MSQPVPTWLRVIFKSARNRALKKGLRFDIKVEDLLKLFTDQDGRCFWFNVPMMFPMDDEDILRSPFLPSLDRVDSSRGYTHGNVVFACWAANAAKGSCPPERWEEFLGYLRAGLQVGPEGVEPPTHR